MPSNNNSKSAWSRQMRRLRQQVDRIDLKILRLLQQRTKLSGRIGATKRRHRAVIYVPERERELLARITRLSNGKLPARAVVSIYREILSSSRAAQGQGPIGLLKASASRVMPAGRWCFGACDEFQPCRTWTELATGLAKGSLALALLTGEELAAVVKTPKGRNDFESRFAIAGDFPECLEGKASAPVYIVTPRGKGELGRINRLVVLIECKSTVNAVKTLLRSMPARSFHLEQTTLRAPPVRGGTVAVLLRLTLAKAVNAVSFTDRLQAAGKSGGFRVSILGVYPSTEIYGG